MTGIRSSATQRNVLHLGEQQTSLECAQDDVIDPFETLGRPPAHRSVMATSPL